MSRYITLPIQIYAPTFQALEGRLKSHVDVSVHRHNEDLTRLKRDCRDGFSPVHDSIAEMKEVLEGNRKLLEEQLRKEMNQIRKMVVLIRTESPSAFRRLRSCLRGGAKDMRGPFTAVF